MSHQSSLLQHLFGRPDITSVKEEQLNDMIGQYPYFAHIRWFKALKAASDGNSEAAVSEAALFSCWPLRIAQFLEYRHPVDHQPDGLVDFKETSNDQMAQSPVPDHHEPAERTGKNQDHELPPLIQPLFTRDYFAYTGQKLPDQIDDDKRPTMEQLHSFTGWLRTLKHHHGDTDPDLKEDAASMAARVENEDISIRKNAEQSLKTDQDILTEAMAEVRLNNGQVDKAIDIYEKLSLSNPEKSTYFAQKIADLKNN